MTQIADLQEKLTFQAIWKVLIFSLEMTRLLKIEKWLEAWPLGCHPARNGHVTQLDPRPQVLSPKSFKYVNKVSSARLNVIGNAFTSLVVQNKFV